MPAAQQLVSYIAPAAPATRRPARGGQPRVRPEIGFTPAWFRQYVEVDFGRPWHTEPAYRRQKMAALRGVLEQRFPGLAIGRLDEPGEAPDLLTGTYGACTVAAIYGVPIVYAADNWPNCEHRYLSAEQLDRLRPPDLDTNPFIQQLLAQVDWIHDREGRVEGFINWQGVLNNAERLRGPQLFLDMMDQPARARRLFEMVCQTMIDAATRLHAKQRATGVAVDFFTVSNCLVNMISPKLYADLLLPLDLRIAESFRALGIHNCAWTADPYMQSYAQVPNLAYIDMGQDSDLVRARDLFPDARRAIMITPMALAGKRLDQIRADLRRIARDYAPCDIVLADIEAGTPDDRVRAVVEFCGELS